jgi:hypothetical protein
MEIEIEMQIKIKIQLQIHILNQMIYNNNLNVEETNTFIKKRFSTALLITLTKSMAA